MQDRLDRPIRVVIFGSGPRLTRDAARFLCLLEDHPEIELLCAFCQSQGETLKAIFQDLRKRRGALAAPLFLAWLGGEAAGTVVNRRENLALKKKLSRLADRIRFVPDIHAPEILSSLKNLKPDLGLIYGSPILKPALFELPALGTIGIHHGKVPQYRGNKTTFWAMYNGEKAAGVTIQKINAGLDTGSILIEGEVPIGKRPYRRVWRDLEALGLDLYLQAVLQIKNGKAEFRPQAGESGKLYRNPGPADFVSFWFRQVRRKLGLPLIESIQ